MTPSPRTPASNIIELAGYRNTLADLMPIFDAARNGFAIKPVVNDAELVDGLTVEESE